jgi:hypothetical protein
MAEGDWQLWRSCRLAESNASGSGRHNLSGLLSSSLDKSKYWFYGPAQFFLKPIVPVSNSSSDNAFNTRAM